MLLSRVTDHKITNFRCKYLATIAMGNDDERRDGRRDTMTMAADDGDNEVDGNGVTGNNDGYVR